MAAQDNCQWCNQPFPRTPSKGSPRAYCTPRHRTYANHLNWLLRKQAEARLPPTRLDAETKKRIDEAVSLTVKHYRDTLKKLEKM